MIDNVNRTLIPNIKVLSVYTMGVFYLIVGVQHFTNPSFFIEIVPPFLVFHEAIVYISGFFEIVIGVLLILRKTRKIGSYLIIFLLVAVFPANLYLYLSEIPREALQITKSQALIRLPFQIPLIIIAYWHSGNSNSILLTRISIILFIPTILYFLSL